MKSFIAILAFVLPFAAFAETSAFWPSHVQVCRANLGDSGQGVAYEMVIQYRETDDAFGSCEVAYYYGFEYGSDTGFRSMHEVFPQSTRNLSCQVSVDGERRTLAVRTKSGKLLVEACELSSAH